MVSRIHVFIKGDVIGVGFRAWTLRNARDKQLIGWVKNTGENLVEAVFEGEKERVDQMIELCHQGPEVSWVDKVDVKWEEATGEFDGFNIL